MVAVADGFLGRWSQRKRAAQEGKALDDVPPAPQVAPPTPTPDPASAPAPAPAPEPAPEPAPVPPPLTLDDVHSLTAESSYAPFVARDVSPAVRNAAMKKLFTDPHYNVMDRLDIYIDDYSKPDPLPAAMLRKMASAKFLKLFEEEEEEESGKKAAGPAEERPVKPAADDPAPHDTADHSVAPSEPPPASTPFTENQPPARGTDHDHTDLRLQPNHAAGPQEPGRSAE